MSDGADLIFRHFPDLDATQRDRFTRLEQVYAALNARVNLISRKDFEHLYERHVLHSLGIAKVAQLTPGMRVMDVGTGGGFPLVPLAILFPQCRFHGIDGTGKKIAAVNKAIQALGLTNCTAEQVRSEDHRGKYDVIVSRAVTTLPEFIGMTKHLVRKGEGRLLYLKGGELADELLPVRQPLRVHELSRFFPGEFFVTKKVVEVEM